MQNGAGMVVYRDADITDIDFLVENRLEFTFGMRGLDVKPGDEKYERLRENCFRYFRKALTEQTCDIVLAFEDNICVGTGIVFYYDSVPSSFNLSGKNAYVTSMFVAPAYRRCGIGTAILKRLIHHTQEKGYDIVMLNASEMGKGLYRKFGFEDIHNGMIRKIQGECI